MGLLIVRHPVALVVRRAHLECLRVVFDLKRDDLIRWQDFHPLREKDLLRAVTVEAYAARQRVEAVFEDRFRRQTTGELISRIGWIRRVWLNDGARLPIERADPADQKVERLSDGHVMRRCRLELDRK